MVKLKVHPQQLALNRALINAAATTSVLKVKSALEFGADVDFQDGDQCGWSALHFCCYFSATEKSFERLSKLLFAAGADVNLCAKDGATPMLTAASVGSVEMVRLLIFNKCKLDLVDKIGWTPLMGAVDRGSVEIVDVLLAAGADVSLIDINGLTALDVANERGNYEIASRIEESILRAEIFIKPRVGV